MVSCLWVGCWGVLVKLVSLAQVLFAFSRDIGVFGLVLVDLRGKVRIGLFACFYVCIFCDNSVLCIYNVGARNSVFCYIFLLTVARLIIHIIFTIVLFTLIILFS